MLEVNVPDTSARDRIRVDFRFATGPSRRQNYFGDRAGSRSGWQFYRVTIPFGRVLILRPKPNFL